MKTAALSSYGTGKAVRGQLTSPSLGKTAAYALQSIRLRFGRCLITAACVVGAIAFLAYNGLALGGLPTMREDAARGAAGAVAETAGAGADFFAGLDAFTQERNVAQKRLFVIALSLLVSLVGITNSMLMSIKERYREIATLKCLGAVNAYIRKLFLLESAFQGGVGSLAGALLGLLLHVLVQTPVASPVWMLQVSVGCLVLGIVMTLLAAVWPIHAALAMMPVEALRVEE